ncbi:MAG TPA: hypothetical protein VE978_06570 [Chitinophagales bacterium]|nr:hypothetical protein [Chitinophagales bacterium]
MKTTITKDKPRSKSRANQNRNKAIRTKLLKRIINEGAVVSQQGDNLEEPHQARPSAENRGELYIDPLEYMKYRIFETIRYIKP